MSFNEWIKIGSFDLNTVANYILTGKTVKRFKPDEWLYSKFDKNNSLNILDFGCGIGRNSYGMALYSDKWNIIGYDNENMIKKAKSYYKRRYKNDKIPKNVKFISNWKSIQKRKFDYIVCMLVLQHIYEKDIINYISDFKKIANILIVSGRRNNDDDNKNTWKILKKCGLKPIDFSNSKKINFRIEGSKEEHSTCFYRL